MNALTAALKEELNVEMVSIGGLQVPESVVVSWGTYRLPCSPSRPMKKPSMVVTTISRTACRLEM